MKKIMVSAAIVCAAMMAQAAQVDWSFEVDDVMGSYEISDNATYFMIAGGETVGADLASLLTTEGKGADLASLLTTEGKGADAFTAALAGYKYNTGKISSGAAQGRIDGLESEDYAAIFIFNDGVVAESTFAYNVYDASGNIYTPPTASEVLQAYASDFGDSDYAASWGTGAVAVPEPTSGLLMLVGLAGLALRRRRA